jgi:mediator of replication checkpoint protein 1
MGAPVAMMDVAPEASSPIHSKATLPLSDLASEAQSSDDDSDGGAVVKPRARGRLAARMLDSMDVEEQEVTAMSDSDVEQAKDMEEAKAKRRRRFLGITSSGEDDAAAESEAENDDNSSDAGDQGMTARERMLKSLMTEKKPAQEEQTTNQADASDDEDIVVPSRSNHRIRQKSSPRPSPPRSQDSGRGGLFVSPSPSPNKARSPPPADSDSEDLPVDLSAVTSTDRFKALLERKRQERVEKDAADLARRKAAAEQQALLEDDDLVGSDDEGGRRLTQQVRPTRKASKKAVEEIHRESQRMARNMQLAHQAKTKKKITKSSLFARFNYKPEGFVEEPATSSSPRQSDAEMHETPPTSPLSPSLTAHKSAPAAEVPTVSLPRDSLSEDEEAPLPTMEDMISSHVASSPSSRRLDNGKGKAIRRSPTPTKSAPQAQPVTTQPKAPKFSANVSFGADSGSDDDLEIIPSKPQLEWKYRSKKDLDSIFDRAPVHKARESNGLHALRMLARISSPPKNRNKKNAKPSISNSALQASLQLRARQQATREREERLQALRDRGIIVQTAEERAQELEDVEDMITKARREGEEIAKGEKAAAKKNRKDNGEVDPLDMDDSDDEEWQEEAETFSQQLSPSGSEDEADDEEEHSGSEDEEMEDATSADMDEATRPNALVDDEEEEEEVDGEVSGLINDEEEEEASNAVSRRRTKNTNVISDDEDDVSVPQSPALAPMNTPGPKATATTSPAAPMSVLRSATKTFIPGITVAGPAGLGLTQIFAGTMDTQPDFDATPMESPSQRLDSQQDSLAFLRNLPPPEFPGFTPTMDDESQGIVKSSQVQIDHVAVTQPTHAETQGIQLDFSQSQIHGFDSLVQQTPSKHSEFPEPTQDEGFKIMSPIMGRYTQPPQSTVDTVMIGGTPAPDQTEDIVMESPVMKRKGKLHRRAQAPVLSDDEEVEPVDDFEVSNIFETMRKASKKSKTAPIADFDKKKSAAKEMVEDQASESEDEYAGLGGASDDESEGEDEVVQAMIDDEQRENFDESKLAAFYADRERAADEQQVNKLFKDITSGMLRKKRGADYDLSDSDDDGEARRRMKRREFAKMRKALLEDEQIGKIAENPKRAAFLRAIEDRGDDQDMIFLDDEIVDAENAASSQPMADDEDSQDATVVPNSQPDAAPSALKRKATTEPQARPPPNLRRTRALASKRPTSLSEIRASVSSLIDDPNAMHAPAEDSDSDIEIEGTESDGGKGKENHDPFARRHAGSAVVDRMSLKRQSSTEMSSATRLAFAASSATAGFKVPPLLRRATTNSSAASSTGSFGGGAAGDSKAAPKKGKGVAFFTREEERTKDIREGERKRQEILLKGVEGRRRAVGGLFGRGSFA